MTQREHINISYSVQCIIPYEVLVSLGILSPFQENKTEEDKKVGSLVISVHYDSLCNL